MKNLRSFPIVVLSLALAILPLGSAFSTVTPATLKESEASVQALAAKAMPCTVALVPGGPGDRFGVGSGVIVSEDGLILTAAHVAMEMLGGVAVIFPDGDRVEAEVLGIDYSRDAAMVQITGGGKYPFVEVGQSAGLKENEWCIAMGHANGFQTDRTPPVRLGRVIDNDPDQFLRSDCALIGGDSGGPLFDLDGKVIGIHSNIGFSLSSNNHVPISIFLENWDRLKAGKRFGGTKKGDFLRNPDRAVIGAVLADGPGGKGTLVESVLPDSPAEKSGIEVGDSIIRIGDVEIKNTDAAIDEIGQRSPGDDLKLVVKGAKEEREITLKLASASKLSGFSTPPTPGPRPERRRDRDEVEPPTAEEREALQAEFNKKMRDSIKSGELRFDPDDLSKFGGPEGLRDFMEELEDELSPDDLAKLMRIGEDLGPIVKPGVYDPDQEIPVGEGFFREVLTAFRPSVVKASDSTHLVFRGSEWKSLCTVVSKDGYALTKLSEIETQNNQALTVMLSKDRQVPAKMVKSFPSHDLALLKLEAGGKLTPVVWSAAGETPPIGSFLAAAGSGPDPVAIGLVSVPPRVLSGQKKGFLGIGTSWDKLGVRISQILPGGNAGKAGLETGDIITKIDDEVCDTPEKLIKAISGTAPGATVEIGFIRDGEPQTKSVSLGDRGEIDSGMGDGGKMNKMGTEVSKNNYGYPQALQSDLPIRPEECGGPVVDLDGNVIGINIARAGRIKTYALPASEVVKLIEPELKRLSKKEAKAGPKETPAAAEPEALPKSVDSD